MKPGAVQTSLLVGTLATLVSGVLVALGNPSTAAVAKSGTAPRPSASLVAIDAKTGRTHWKTGGGDSPKYLSLLGANGSLVIGEELECGGSDALSPGSTDVSLVARSTHNGDVKWRTPVRSLTSVNGLEELDIPATGVAGNASVIVAGRDGTIRGLDPKTGRARWKRDIGPFDILGASTRYVLITTGTGAPTAITVLDRATGRPAWTHDVPAGRSLGVSAIGERVVAEIENPVQPSIEGAARLVVFDALSGAQRWEHPLGPGASGVFVGKSSVVVAAVGPVPTLALDAATGEKLWEMPSGTVAFLGAPDAHHQLTKLVLSRQGSELTAIDPRDGRVRWTTPAGAGSTLASNNELVVELLVTSTARELIGISAADGKQRWRRPRPADIGNAAIGDGVVLLGGGCEPPP